VNDDEPGFLDLLLDGLNVGLGYLVATGVIALIVLCARFAITGRW
jgi:hypothetical protein